MVGHRKRQGLIPDTLDLLEIAHVIPVKISIIDLDGRFVYLNDTYVRWLGIERDLLLNQKVTDIVRPQSDMDCVEIIREVYKSGRQALDLILVHPDSSLRVVHLELVPNPGNKTVFSFLRDITAERTSATNEAKFKALFDTASEGVIVMNEQGVITAFNRAAELQFGWKAEEVIGRDVTMLMPPSYATNHSRFVARYMETGEAKVIGDSAGIEAVCVRKDGSSFPSSIAVAEFVSEGVHYFTGIVRDITEHKKYETQILAERARLEAVVDTAVDTIIVIDEIGTIESINRAGVSAFGYSEVELKGQNIKLLMPQSYAAKHDSYLKRYRDTGQRHIIGDSVEGEGLRRDGTVFPCELAVAEFVAGGKRFFTGIIRDISERKNHTRAMQEWNQNLERELQKRGRALDQIFNLSSDVLALMSYDGHFVSVSPSAEKMTGIPVDQAIREKIHFSRFAIEEDRAGLEAVIKRVIDTGQPVLSYEFRVTNIIDAAPRWTAWSAKPVPEDRLIIVVGRDVTVEKQREDTLRQSQKMEAIGQLTGGIAHDFNNILMGIMGSLDLIHGKLSDDVKLEKYVTAAMTSAKKAAALTQRLLAFSRRQPLAPIAVPTNELIKSMGDMLTRSIGPDVTLSFELDIDAEPIFCDPNQLENSLLNLVINSRDAIPESGNIVIRTCKVTREIARVAGLPGADFVGISCTDNGVGMDESTRERVFDPFFTTKPIGKGTGLGLSMLYGFVNQSGGHVRLETVPGDGTTLTMYLPRSEKLPLRVSEQTAMSGRIRQVEGRKLRILLIEDEDVIRHLVQDVLETSGFEVVPVAEGNAALAEISDTSKQIDLVVSDVGLPGLNGKQIAEMGRIVRPDLRTLFITGYAAGVTLRNEWLADGMDMILKPFKMETLIAKVEEMIAD